MRYVSSLMVLILSILFSACSGAEKELKTTVRLYNDLLAKSYREMDTKPLASVAGQDQVLRVFRHMSSFGQGKVRMDPTLNRLTFLACIVKDTGLGEVKTEEDWTYRYLEIDSGKTVYQNKVFYIMIYQLAKTNNAWQITKVQVESAKEERQDDFLPFFQRPDKKSQ